MRLPPLQEGRLIRRYKRFLADVELPGGTLTAWCPNPGAMTSVARPGQRVWLSHHPGRKLEWTWTLAELEEGVLAFVDTTRVNAVVGEALPRLYPGAAILREQRLGASRVDFTVDGAPLEVKGVSLRIGDEGAFPDAVTTRGTRHLEELRAVAEAGGAATLLFAVLRPDLRSVRAAREIDPAYAAALGRAAAAGVRIRAFSTSITPTELSLAEELPVRLDP